MAGIRHLTRGLLVIVGAEAFPRTEITELSGRGHIVGRLSLDVAVDPAVDLAAARTFLVGYFLGEYSEYFFAIRYTPTSTWSIYL